jgi:hypothetical protein
MPEDRALAWVAEALQGQYQALGMPSSPRDLAIPESGLRPVVVDSWQNDNADLQRRFLQRRSLLLDMVHKAW